ncbi:MAG TPA: helix-turn-helix domain-containing protein, partial [Phytomonospora sp.]
MLQTSARLLKLLSLLEMRRDWAGDELAGRLEVTTRTVRRDVDKLRELGYPVHATTGPRFSPRELPDADVSAYI